MFEFKRVGLSVLVLSLAGSAQAAVIQFDNSSSFTGAAGPLIVENFNAAATGAFATGTAVDFGDFSITNPDANQAVGVYTAADVNLAQGSAIGTSNQLAWGENSAVLGGGGTGDGATFTLNFDHAITAIGFDYSDSDFSDQYRITIDGIDIALTGTGEGFQNYQGFISDTAFTSVTFSQVTTGGQTEAFSLDNLAFSAAPLISTPLPAGIPLVLTGAAMFGALRSRKRA